MILYVNAASVVEGFIMKLKTVRLLNILNKTQMEVILSGFKLLIAFEERSAFLREMCFSVRQ